MIFNVVCLVVVVCFLFGICGNGGCEVMDMNKYFFMYKCICVVGYVNVGNFVVGYCFKDCKCYFLGLRYLSVIVKI